jgi:hypothetical protein
MFFGGNCSWAMQKLLCDSMGNKNVWAVKDPGFQGDPWPSPKPCLVEPTEFTLKGVVQPGDGSCIWCELQGIHHRSPHAVPLRARCSNDDGSRQRTGSSGTGLKQTSDFVDV